MRYRMLAVTGTFIAFFLWAGHATHAAFTPGFIISDLDFTDTSPTAKDVQSFLGRHSGVLATIPVMDQNGSTVRLSDALVQIGQLFRISPKVLLTTMQKEQSVIDDPTPSQRQLDWAMGYSVCDSCGGVGDVLFSKGLYNQIYYAAKQYRNYIDNAKSWRSKMVGGTYTICDTYKSSNCQQVTLQNQGTVNLYLYTPYIHGNQLFYNIYSSWFSKVYPDGTLLRVGTSGGIWLIQDGMRWAFQNRAAFITRYGNFSKVIQTTADTIEAYPRGPNITLPNYSLVQTPDGNTYLLSGDQKRLIASQAVFQLLGFNPQEVIQVSATDLQGYLDGVTISNADAYPAGALVKVKENGGITWIEQGIWYPIIDRSIIQSRFPGRSYNVVISLSELQKYQKGPALTLRDGELVRLKGDLGVYVISNGQRRAITSRKLFDALGYKMKNVIVISPQVAALHPVGDSINTVTN